MIKIKDKKKYIVIVLTLIVVIAAFKIASSYLKRKSYEKISAATVNYLNVTSNRRKNIDEAARLNNGSYTNTCVYFASGALRAAGLDVPKSVGNTTQLIEFLQKEGYKKYYDLNKLEPGDICFAAPSGNVSETPDHTYIFDKWTDSSHKDAYIFDNQLTEYGSCYHVRNVTYKTVRNSKSKSPAIYFMRVK